MTSINIASEIPTNINTLEKLAVWVCQCLVQTNPTLKVTEVANADPEKVAQLAIAKANDDTTRAICRLSIPIDSAYASYTKKFWENAQDLSNTALPAAYKVN